MESVLLVLLCLSGWFILPSCPLRQYYFVNEPLTWHEAQTYCRERFSDLATIHNMTEMNYLIDRVSSAGYDSEVGIGASAEVNWKWSDGSEYEYVAWANDQPRKLTSAFCVVTTLYGDWADDSCHTTLRFICYKGTQQNPEFELVDQALPWSDAQAYCRQNFIDLATVRNDAEQAQVNTQKATQGDTYAWIGLSRDNPNFQWSDGSSFIFSHFADEPQPFGPEKVICGAALMSDLGKWRFPSCDTRRPFVCNTPFVNRVVKLRIKLDDSSVDLNDPAVKAALLKKIQDRLKEEGVNEVNLKWREQPDGEVWHKEEL